LKIGSCGHGNPIEEIYILKAGMGALDLVQGFSIFLSVISLTKYASDYDFY